MSADTPSTLRLLARVGRDERRRVTALLRTETVGGALLIVAAIIALIWANSPAAESYLALGEVRVGPADWHLDLSLSTWAADGLLAVFFFMAGMELKRELVAGDLRDPAKATVPVVAALAGVVTPALLFVLTVHLLGGGPAALRGWAVPTATDIAFALAVLAVAGTHLPSAMRSFLLTLAVVDDLVAIVIIAVVYTESVSPLALLGALLPLVAFAAVVRRPRALGRAVPLVLALLAAATWVLVHAGGIHATVAGVLLGLAVPVGTPLAHRLEHVVHPVSSGVAVPVFAFFAAGVPLIGAGASGSGSGSGAGAGAGAGVGSGLFADPVAVGVVVALVLGKLIGVLGGTWAVARFTRAELDEGLSWWDVVGLALLAGIGFTVSLLVGSLAYGAGSPHELHVRAAVLVASAVSATLAIAVLRTRNASYRRLALAEEADEGEGQPD